jgi:hypothetical protein
MQTFKFFEINNCSLLHRIYVYVKSFKVWLLDISLSKFSVFEIILTIVYFVRMNKVMAAYIKCTVSTTSELRRNS